MNSILSLLIGIILFSSLNARGEISFSKLAKGDVIKVTYKSVGCFHNEEHVLEFRRSDSASVKVSQVVSNYDKDYKLIASENVEIGSLKLSDKDLSKLETLFAFYRKNKESGCTTRDHIKIVLLNGEKVESVEEYKDESCETANMKDIAVVSLN